jgi:hypothetical protein
MLLLLLLQERDATALCDQGEVACSWSESKGRSKWNEEKQQENSFECQREHVKNVCFEQEAQRKSASESAQATA